MSFGGSPSPVPLSGSLLVTETSWNVGDGSQMSVAGAVTVIGTILWLGGHSSVRSSAMVKSGGVVSTTRTSAVQVEVLPFESLAVNVTVVTAHAVKLSGASLVMT